MFIERHLQLNLGFRSENFVFTGEGFSPNSGFRSILCSQERDSVLIWVSQNFSVHQRILYVWWQWPNTPPSSHKCDPSPPKNILNVFFAIPVSRNF